MLAIPRTSTLRLRKGREKGPAREHLAAVARKGFMAGETMRREERRENRVSKDVFEEDIEMLRVGKEEGERRCWWRFWRDGTLTGRIHEECGVGCARAL